MDRKELDRLSKYVPFSFLPQWELESLLDKISLESYNKGTMLFVQGTTPIDRIYIFKTGSGDRYFDQGKKKILRGKLGEGEIIGGISILLNNSIIIRTLVLTEDSEFYLLSSDDFLELCNMYDYFKEYFTNIFGKQMLDRSYAGIVSTHAKEEDPSLLFFSQPIAGICCSSLVTCNHDTSIKTAALQMTRHGISSIFIKNSQGAINGIVTDSDLRKKVVAAGHDTQLPVSEIMSSPLNSIPLESQVFEAFMKIMQDNLKHLPLRDAEGNITGVVTDKDIIAAQGDSPYLMIREIQKAKTIAAIIAIHERLPGILLTLMQSGAKAGNLSKLVTAVSDAILNRIIDFAVNKLGKPPCRFVFMIMGSEGRGEQTLKTDQDNAIIYETIFDRTEHEMIRRYFLNFGNLVCTWLDKAGYNFCEGDNMAKNPMWCQPIDIWKEYFHDWIRKADPEDLLHSSIFFDFKGAWGNLELVDELRDFLFKSLGGWSGFFRSLTENALHFKPPIGFFRNIVVESQGEHKNSFDIKRAMLPVVDFARIYALKNYIKETNTQKRLLKIYAAKNLTDKEYHDIDQAYNYLLQLRFIRQVTAILEEKREPDNFCNPNNLSRLDQKMLKEIFKRIEKLQLKLSLDFIGII